MKICLPTLCFFFQRPTVADKETQTDFSGIFEIDTHTSSLSVQKQIKRSNSKYPNSSKKIVKMNESDSVVRSGEYFLEFAYRWWF